MATLAVCLLAGTVACTSTDSSDTAPSASTSRDTGVPVVPNADPANLPARWDGQNGLFQITGNPAYTPDGILTVRGTGVPTAWSWSGQSHDLVPDTPSGATADLVESYLVPRAGQWSVVSLWTDGTTSSGPLGDVYATTWNSKGEQMSQVKLQLDPQTRHRDLAGLTATNDGTLAGRTTATGSTVLDPTTGRVTTGDASAAAQDLATPSNPALVISVAAPDTWTIKNLDGSTVTTVKKSDTACGAAPTELNPTALVSSLDGRYLAVGRWVYDADTRKSSCLDVPGGQLTAITADGTGYGLSGRKVFSYDFGSGTTEDVPTATVAPEFIGPNGEAVVLGQSFGGGADGARGVYPVAG